MAASGAATATRSRKPRAAAPKAATEAKTKTKRTISADHRAAIATGRAEYAAINEYLVALAQNRPRRGKFLKKEELEARLEQEKKEIANSTGLERLGHIQARDAYQERLDNLKPIVDLSGLEEQFVKNAKSFSNRKKITKKMWREIGVPPEVLAKAGI